MKKYETHTDDLREKETSNDPHHPDSLRHSANASRKEKQLTCKEDSSPASNLIKDPHDPDHLRNRAIYRANAAAKEKAEEVEEEETDEVEKGSTSRVPSHDPHEPKFPR